MVSTEDFFRDRKLRKISPDKDKCLQSMRISETKLQEAKNLFDSEFYESAIIMAYTSMFHSARAILYSEGIQEKSHYAVYVYLKEKYESRLGAELISAFLSHQNERKEILYGFENEVSDEDASSALEDAELFLIKVKEILDEKVWN